MTISLILAVTFVPLVLVLVLLGLALAWLRMGRTNRDDVVDLVELQKEAQKPVAPDDKYESRTSTEPFPQLPSMNLHHTGDLIDSSYAPAQSKSYGELKHATVPSVPPVAKDNLNPSNGLSTPPKRSNSITKSPSREALAAFDFDTPPKPPIPTRSLKRASGSRQIPIEAVISPTPTIKIEPASPSNASAASDQIQPLRLSPTMIGRAHARRTIEAAHNDEIASIPFSSVPITHIQDPTSENLPPTPTRASTYPSLPSYVPKDAEGMRAMMKNREMMEIEAWRPDKAAALKQSSGVNMHGKHNSAIREYVRNFPEQNPWRKMIARRSRDVHATAAEEDEEGGLGEEEFIAKFTPDGGNGVAKNRLQRKDEVGGQASLV